ncbi:MAG: hypothetical protein IKS83_03620 [Victivallales bacterium]|nr:hypothetical protein [Victivallales bacterium]
MKMKTLFALMVVGLAALVHGQTKITVETPATVITETQTTVTIKPEPQPVSACKVVLIVQNHAAPGVEIPMMALTDALAAKLSGRGFQVINPYDNVGYDQNRSVVGEETPEVSAVRLAQQLGADGLVTVSVLEFLDTKLGGNPPVLHQYSVRVSVSLADANSGAVICGEPIRRKSPKYTNNQDAANRLEYLGELLHDTAGECATKLEENPAAYAWRASLAQSSVAAVGQLPGGVQRASRVTLPAPPSRGTSLDRRIDALVWEMLMNSQFLKNYEESQARRDGRLPVVVLGGIANKSGDAGLDALIEAGGERFRVMLFNSKRFEVKDDNVLVDLAKRIVASGNSPLENGELMGELKRHDSPDFYVVGDLKFLNDLDGVAYYKLRLAIHSLLTGKIVWEGIETFNN